MNCATDVKKKKKKKKATGNTSFESVSRLYNTGALHRSVSWSEREKRWDDDNANRTF